MAPPKKKLKRALPDEKMTKMEAEPLPKPDPGLLDDHRISWLLASEDKFVQVKAQGVLFRVHKTILTRHSDFFDACLNRPFREAAHSAISFDDIDPRSLALYLGVAYSFASIVPHDAGACPPPSSYFASPLSAERTTLRDYVEVYKLSDRFMNPRIGRFILKCLDQTIGARHSEMFRSSELYGRAKTWTTKALSDSGGGGDKPTSVKPDKAAMHSHDDWYRRKQMALVREFADGYEALEMAHDEQKKLGQTMIKYFCGGVDYMLWSEGMEGLMDRPRFVGGVSGEFARQLGEGGRRVRKRKELKGP